MTHEIIMKMARLMPIEKLIEMVDEAIQKWNNHPTDEHMNGIQSSAMVFLAKLATQNISDEEMVLLESNSNC